MSRYFLEEDQILFHGAQIVSSYLEDPDFEIRQQVEDSGDTQTSKAEGQLPDNQQGESKKDTKTTKTEGEQPGG